MRLKDFFENGVRKVRTLGRVLGARKSNRYNLRQLKEKGIAIKRLTAEQKKEVDRLFAPYRCRYSYTTHRLYYSVTGRFDAAIMPEDLFRTQIELKMNDPLYKKVLSNKALFEKLLPEVNFPVTVIRNIDGLFFDGKYRPISAAEAKEILSRYKEVVFKPTEETGGGRGVHPVDLEKEDPLQANGKNYLLQERIVQHEALARLNPSSVNVVRIMTWFNGSEVVPIHAELHVGGAGLFTDNQTTEGGFGMTCTGLTKEGRGKSVTVHPCGVLTDKSATGVPLEGYRVPCFDQMLAIATAQHTQLPRIDFIGWDFTVDQNEKVVVIEYNIKCPGLLCQQYVNGPLFGEFTEQMLEKYLKKR